MEVLLRMRFVCEVDDETRVDVGMMASLVDVYRVRSGQDCDVSIGFSYVPLRSEWSILLRSYLFDILYVAIINMMNSH